MPPKARNALRGPGRKAVTAEATLDATPAKRGRPAAKADAVEVAVEPPKKRGRPAKAKAEEAEPAIQDMPQPKKRGRPSLHAPKPIAKEDTPKKSNGKAKKGVDFAEAVEEAPVPKKRGRPRKEETAGNAPVTPKRGRPAKTAALDLNRVTGSARVGKRSSPRSKPTKFAAAPPRQDPRVRSKLRTRIPQSKNNAEKEGAPIPARRGRPPKNATQTAAPKKAGSGRKAIDAAVAKPTKPTKPWAPRKMRGHTVRQIPDKYVAQVDQFLHELMEADSSDAAPGDDNEVEGDQDEAQDDMDPTSGPADDEGHEDGIVLSEQDREEYEQVREYSEGAGVDTDGQQDDAEDEHHEEEQEEQGEEVVVAQSDQSEERDDFDENMSGESDIPLQEIQPAMSMQGTIIMEQDVENGVAFGEEVHMEIAAGTSGSEDAQEPLSGEDKENVIYQPSRPSASLIFG